MVERILVVEDETTLQETLVYNLKRHGYTVAALGDGLAAVKYARENHPDLILLDVMLPGIDGFEVCRILRKEMNTPILILTARDEEIDRVVGLELGADDYISKPFSMRELMARVKTRLRSARLILDRQNQTEDRSADVNQLVFGNLLIDLKRRELRRDGVVVAMKPKEFDLLAYLAQNQDVALSRETVLERVWGWDYIGDSRTVDVHVRWLREKIEADPANPHRIVTVRGTGYRFDG